MQSAAYTEICHDRGTDGVAIEEPLEIRVDGEPLAVTAPSGELLRTRGDVGRHNAMDKVIGRALLDGIVRELCGSSGRPRPARAARARALTS